MSDENQPIGFGAEVRMNEQEAAQQAGHYMNTVASTIAPTFVNRASVTAGEGMVRITFFEHLIIEHAPQARCAILLTNEGAESLMAVIQQSMAMNRERLAQIAAVTTMPTSKQ